MARDTVWLALLAVLPGLAWAGGKESTLTDYLRHDWQDEVVRFPVEFPPGECDGKNVALWQAWNGQRVAYQFVDGKSYRFTVRLYNRLDYAHVTEEANVDKASAFVFSAHSGFAPTHWVRPYHPAKPLGYRENRGSTGATTST